MAWRLGDWVECGELLNTRNYSTHGWIGLRGQKQPVHIELTGNMSPDLQGWHIRFEPRPPTHKDAMRSRGEEHRDRPTTRDLKGLAWQQIGATGTMSAARMVRTFDCSIEEFLMRCKAGEPPVTPWKRSLYLEWFSQNGRVVIELADPILEFVEYVGPDGQPRKMAPPEPEPVPPCDEAGRPLDPGGPSATIVRVNDEGEAEVEQVTSEDIEAERERDPYGLVSDDLQHRLDAQSREMDRSLKDEGGGSEDDEEVERTMRETELVDDLIDHEEGELLKDLLPGKPKLYNPDKLGDEEVEGELKGLVSLLALMGIAFDVCEHFTPREAYRLLVNRVLRKERAFPQLRGTQWVQHYGTHDYCKQCEAQSVERSKEIERKLEQERQDEA